MKLLIFLAAAVQGQSDEFPAEFGALFAGITGGLEEFTGQDGEFGGMDDVGNRLAQGASDEFNYCRKCTGQTAAECITSNLLETCNVVGTTCMVTLRQSKWRGEIKYWSECSEATSCAVQEKQNFHALMRFSECMPPNKVGPRWFRGITCNFCHKMGTQSGTHLLFQNNNSGANDADSILFSDGNTFTVQSISGILDDPASFFTEDNMSGLQLWY